MALTDNEKEAVRYHLGYLGVSSAASIQLGIPRPVQTLFLVEQALDNLREIAVPRVRSILGTLNGVEQKLICSQDRLAAAKLGSMTLRGVAPGESEADGLEREYTRWAGRLADILGCPFYPGAHRFGGASGGVNVPVSN